MEDVSESDSSSSAGGVAFRFKDGTTVGSRTDRPGIGNEDFETFYASVGALYWILDTTIDPADFVTDKSAGSVLFPPSRNLSLQVPSQSIEKLNIGCLRISILRTIRVSFL